MKASSTPGDATRRRGNGVASLSGRLPFFLTTHHPFLSLWHCAMPAARGSGCGGTREQVFQGLADLHKLIQTGRLGNELGDSQVPEQRFVPTGAGRAPYANRYSGQVPGITNLE